MELARTVANLLEDKKGEDILLLDIHELADFAEYFVICTGTSDRMLDALANAVVDDLRTHHRKKGRKQGQAREGWMVVDYGDVVVHLFSPDQREFYQLEDLWGLAGVWCAARCVASIRG